MPAGDLSDALEQLLQRSASRVHQIAARHRLDPATVDEVFQEVRIRIWKAFAAAPERIATLPASYVYQTAGAAAIDLIRRRRARRADVSVPIEVATPLAALDRPGDQPLEQSELRTHIDAAVGELAPARRPVVRLHLEGYSREEIERLVGWSEAKVRNLLYRGLADLRAALTRRGIHAGGFDERGS